jgi:hypothetical protein
MVRAWLL